MQHAKLMVALLAALSFSANATNLTYRGQLDEYGKPANGRYDFELRLYADRTGAMPLAQPVVFYDVAVQNGQFELTLDSAQRKELQRDEIWVEAAVRAGSDLGQFASLPGRSKAVALIGQCWSSTGDSGVNPNTNFLGTTDAQPVILRANNIEVQRVRPGGVNINGAGWDDSAELTVRADADSAYANILLEPLFNTTPRSGVLISSGDGTSGNNNQGFYIDHYDSAGGQLRRLAIAPNGSTLISDRVSNLSSSAPNQFIVGAAGGMGVNTLPTPNTALTVNGNVAASGLAIASTGALNFGAGLRQMLNLSGNSADYGIGVQTTSQYFRSGGGFSWYRGGTHSDFDLNPGVGGNRLMALSNSGTLNLRNAPVDQNSPGIRLSFNATGALANSNWDLIATRGADFGLSAGSFYIGTEALLGFAIDRNTLQTRNTSGAWNVLSDARLKKNIHDIASPLDTYLKLRGHWFEYKDPKAVMATAGPRMGFVAQEVAQTLPEWVSTGADGYLSITPTGFEALTVEAVKQLHDENSKVDVTQADQITALQAENAELKARLARIEQLLLAR